MFINLLKKESMYTETENGGVALASTMNAVVDLFASIGAMRDRSLEDVKDKFDKSFKEDALLTLKILFYARDIRFGGLGERKIFRNLIQYCAMNHTNAIEKNIELVPYFGRWDDMYAFVGTPLENKAFDIMKEQILEDIRSYHKGENISLLAKWLKSEGASSVETKRLAKLTMQKLGMSPKVYRITLSKFRTYLDVVEKKMSSGAFDQIDYSSVPSLAMTRYRRAFGNKDSQRFGEYIESLKKGETKINASTLYPYNILEASGLCEGFTYIAAHIRTLKLMNPDDILEQQWRALPNYVEGENNILVMADTSASMTGRPMCTAVGLAIYFAERNKGEFKDKFITFSRRPSFVELKGNSLNEKIECIPSIVSNTDLEAAMQLILETCTKNCVLQEEMPKSLVIISDMQFDSMECSGWNETLYESYEKKFSAAGYQIPNIVFWNVNSVKDTFQVTADKRGVQMVSGQSVSVFKNIINNIGKSSYEAMLEVLKAYDIVKI